MIMCRQTINQFKGEDRSKRAARPLVQVNKKSQCLPRPIPKVNLFYWLLIVMKLSF